MSADINEFYLFHGTSLKKAMLICKNGFDPAAATLYCLYGVGSYFAINSCKSHQYSSKNGNCSNVVMLVCRVALGSPTVLPSHTKMNDDRPRIMTPFSRDTKLQMTDSSITTSTWFSIAVRCTPNTSLPTWEGGWCGGSGWEHNKVAAGSESDPSF